MGACTWWIGSRTQWNVTKDFYMGVDVIYSTIQTATAGLNNAGTIITGLVPVSIANSSCVAGVGATQRCAAENQHDVAVRFRVHRDFYP